MNTPNPAVSVQCAAAVTQGPDGRAVVMVIIASGLGQYQVPVSAETAAQFGDDLRGAIHKAAAEAKRLNLGIVLPGEVPNLGALRASNGRPSG